MHVVSGAVLQQWNALTDEQLVLHVLSGRTALYELLIRRHSERLYRTIRAIVGTDTPAESLLEDTFVHAYAHLRRIFETHGVRDLAESRRDPNSDSRAARACCIS